MLVPRVAAAEGKSHGQFGPWDFDSLRHSALCSPNCDPLSPDTLRGASLTRVAHPSTVKRLRGQPPAHNSFPGKRHLYVLVVPARAFIDTLDAGEAAESSGVIGQTEITFLAG